MTLTTIKISVELYVRRLVQIQLSPDINAEKIVTMNNVLAKKTQEKIGNQQQKSFFVCLILLK
jgi:hypothetical protein